MSRSRLAVVLAGAAVLAGCGGDDPEPGASGGAPPPTTAASASTTAPVTAPAEADELPALPSGDITVGDERTAKALCERYRREPDKTGGRSQVTFRIEGGIDGIVCLLPR